MHVKAVSKELGVRFQIALKAASLTWDKVRKQPVADWQRVLQQSDLAALANTYHADKKQQSPKPETKRPKPSVVYPPNSFPPVDRKDDDMDVDMDDATPRPRPSQQPQAPQSSQEDELRRKLAICQANVSRLSRTDAQLKKCQEERARLAASAARGDRKCQDEIKELTDRIAFLQSDKFVLTKQINEAKAQNATLRDRVSQMEQAAQGRTMDNLTQVGALKSQLSSVESKAVEQGRQLSGVEQILQAEQKKREHLEQTILGERSAASRKVAQLQQQIADLQNERNSIMMQAQLNANDEVRRISADVNGQLVSARAALAQCQSEKSSVEERAKQLEVEQLRIQRLAIKQEQEDAQRIKQEAKVKREPKKKGTRVKVEPQPRVKKEESSAMVDEPERPAATVKDEVKVKLEPNPAVAVAAPLPVRQPQGPVLIPVSQPTRLTGDPYVKQEMQVQQSVNQQLAPMVGLRSSPHDSEEEMELDMPPLERPGMNYLMPPDDVQRERIDAAVNNQLRAQLRNQSTGMPVQRQSTGIEKQLQRFQRDERKFAQQRIKGQRQQQLQRARSRSSASEQKVEYKVEEPDILEMDPNDLSDPEVRAIVFKMLARYMANKRGLAAPGIAPPSSGLLEEDPDLFGQGAGDSHEALGRRPLRIRNDKEFKHLYEIAEEAEQLHG